MGRPAAAEPVPSRMSLASEADERAEPEERTLLADVTTDIVRLILDHGYERRAELFQLSSGEQSYDYIDGKRAMSTGPRLRQVAEAVIETARRLGVEFEAVGGLTMGADPLAHAVSIVAGCDWFAVRKNPKAHGKQRLIEGCDLTQSRRVLLVDDVVTTGGSIIQALDAIEESGGDVVLAVALVDRGKTAADLLASRGIRYQPLATYEHLGIDPVGGG